MTLRYAMACLGGLGSIVVAASCATAGPLTDGRPMLVDRAGDYELQVLVDGAPAPTFAQGNGTYVLGQLGQRYTVRVINHTGRRIEAVVSVDGRDVVDGRSADFRNKRGYLVPAWGQVDIDGWRLSTVQAAAFRFSTVGASYAGRTGSARDVGVIGAAIFPERFVPRPPPRVIERPYPGYDPESWRMRDEQQAPRSAAPAPAPSSRAAEAEAGAPSASQAPAPQNRPGLGTEFGEAVSSPVQEVAFLRANPVSPSVVLGIRYNDRAGLIAMGVDLDAYYACWGGRCDGEATLRETASPFPVVDRRFAAPPPCWQDGTCAR
jgi:hypothetical protein